MSGRVTRETELQALLISARTAVRSGDWSSGLEQYDQAFRLLPSAGSPADAAELLRWTGHIHRMRGDYEVAREHYDAALAVAHATGLPGHAASARNDLGNVAQLEGDLDEAAAHYHAALDGADAIADTRLAAMAEQNLGVVANIRGDVDAALVHYQGALQRYEEVGDDLAAAWALNNIGMAHVDGDRFSEARDIYARALGAARRSGDVSTRATIQLNTAELHLKAGSLAEAWEACDQAFALYSRAESKIGLAETYRLYSALHRESGKPALAEAHLSVVAQLARESQDLLLEAEVQSDRALIHLAEGRSRDALVALNQAHELFQSLEARREVADLERRLDRLEENYVRVVQVWGESIESKDTYTAGHCGRVAELTCSLAARVGFAGRDLRWIRMGAFLHDVGKTAVPVQVLNKPGALNDQEWALVRSHTTAGDALVAEVGFPWDIRPMVRSHHEHWDGSGYPDGLAGEDIPLLARVLCVADIYDALTTHRSYREALGHDEALAVMAREAGRTVDPTLFAEFRTMMEAERTHPAPAGTD